LVVITPISCVCIIKFTNLAQRFDRYRMSHDILDLFLLADYEDVFNTTLVSSIPSYNILPDHFQQPLPPTRTTPPQNT